MGTRSRIFWFGSAALLVVVGIVGALLFTGTLGQVLALVLTGFGFVLATAVVFYEVGLSEDRDRARAARTGTSWPKPRRLEDAGSGSPERRGKARLRRMRGSRRRLS